MKPCISLLLSVLIGAAQASTDTAKVYIFPQPKLPTTSITPTLTLEQTRLVVAQRLEYAWNNLLNHASKDTLEHISIFGGEPSPLFNNDIQDRGRSHLLLLIDGKDNEGSIRKLQERLGRPQPDFEIANPASITIDNQLVKDFGISEFMEVNSRSMKSIMSEVNPLSSECWSGRNKIVYLSTKLNSQDIFDLLEATETMIENVASEVLDVMIIVLPKSSGASASSYSTFGKPAQHLIGRQVEHEEPFELDFSTIHFQTENASSPDNFTRTPPGTFASCYSSQGSCEAGTKNCSGHGKCYAKVNSNSTSSSCYTCQCIASVNITQTEHGEREIVTYWGGQACQKTDVSSQFWLLVTVAILLGGIISAAIGLMFSVGEEQLPGVIGAGVSGPKAR